MTSFPAEADRPLVDLLRCWPGLPSGVRAEPAQLFHRAELHGLAAVVHDSWRRAGLQLPPELRADLEARAIARELDHAAQLELLVRIGSALAVRRVPAVTLKGALLAERVYEHPSARVSTDIDLLVEERRLEDARDALLSVGYSTLDAEYDAASRRHHHHVALANPHALPVELHFQAYAGFGEILPSEPLIVRSLPSRVAGLGILGAPDELVYLAVHAAAHRFCRLAWLHDLRLLVLSMSPQEIELAAVRAREHGYSRALSLAAALLVDVCGVAKERVAAVGDLGRVRAPLVRAVIGEPPSAVLRSATRLAYSALLGQSAASSLRYAKRASLAHARRAIGGAR